MCVYVLAGVCEKERDVEEEGCDCVVVSCDLGELKLYQREL